MAISLSLVLSILSLGSSVGDLERERRRKRSAKKAGGGPRNSGLRNRANSGDRDLRQSYKLQKHHCMCHLRWIFRAHPANDCKPATTEERERQTLHNFDGQFQKQNGPVQLCRRNKSLHFRFNCVRCAFVLGNWAWNCLILIVFCSLLSSRLANTWQKSFFFWRKKRKTYITWGGGQFHQILCQTVFSAGTCPSRETWICRALYAVPATVTGPSTRHVSGQTKVTWILTLRNVCVS